MIDSLPLKGRYFCKQISPFWLDNLDVQGRNEVKWCLGKETSLAPPCSNLRSFGSKCTVLKNVFLTLLWPFGLPQWFGTRGIVPPWPPRYVSGVMQQKSENFPKVNKFSSPNVMNFYSMNIWNFRTQYRMDLAQIANKGYGGISSFFV